MWLYSRCIPVSDGGCAPCWGWWRIWVWRGCCPRNGGQGWGRSGSEWKRHRFSFLRVISPAPSTVTFASALAPPFLYSAPSGLDWRWWGVVPRALPWAVIFRPFGARLKSSIMPTRGEGMPPTSAYPETSLTGRGPMLQGGFGIGAKSKSDEVPAGFAARCHGWGGGICWRSWLREGAGIARPWAERAGAW